MRGKEMPRAVPTCTALLTSAVGVGVVVSVQQVRQAGRGVGDARRAQHAKYQQTVESGGQCGRQCHAKAHARGLGRVEVDHPQHSGIDRQLLATIDGGFDIALRSGGLRVRSDVQGLFDGASGDRQNSVAARVRNGNPPVRQETGLRRGAPGIRARCNADSGKLRRYREILSVRGGGRWTLCRVSRLQHADDPSGARCAEAVCDLLPGRHPRGRIIASQPVLFPVVLAPRLLIRR
jgi:hypothetical protein